MQGTANNVANDQPAIIRHDGSQEWWEYGKQHRIEEATVINPDSRFNKWYLYGVEVAEKKYADFLKPITVERDLGQFQSLPYEYQKNVFISLLNR